jgi:hypothetical protein
MLETKKDTYTYLKHHDGSCHIFKNNIQFSFVKTEDEAKYRCHVLNNFDDLIFSASPTNLVLYLDGRKIGELNVSQDVAEMVVSKISTVFKTIPKDNSFDPWEDVGWEYD